MTKEELIQQAYDCLHLAGCTPDTQLAEDSRNRAAYLLVRAGAQPAYRIGQTISVNTGLKGTFKVTVIKRDRERIKVRPIDKRWQKYATWMKADGSGSFFVVTSG